MRAPSARQWRKAARLLRRRRVHLLVRGQGGSLYRVEGDSGAYEVQWTPQEGWDCPCELREHRPSWACSHIAACWLVEQALKEVGTDAD